MREKTIEHKLKTAVGDIGGLALKFVSLGMDGVPDRLILLPGGRMAFAEVKSTREATAAAAGKKETAIGIIRVSGVRDRQPRADRRCA